MEPQAVPVVPISVYIGGTMLNFFLLYVYWHWYWHVASLWGSAVKVRFGEVVRNANNRSRRDKPRVPKEDMSFLQPLDVDKLQNSTTTIRNGSTKTARRPLQRNETNVSLEFEEAVAKMNGKLLNGAVKNAATRPSPLAQTSKFKGSVEESAKSNGLLEVPSTSKTVRARYPHEPPVLRAMAKREKDETASKPSGAAKRAMYKQKRASKEATIEREPFPTPSKRRTSLTVTSEPKETTAPPTVTQESKRLQPNGAIPGQKRSERRRSTVTIIADPLVIPTTTYSEEDSTPSPPPPPIYATRLTKNAYENRILRAQEKKRDKLKPEMQERTPRRRLPRTPSGTPAGELPRPKFYLSNSEL
ncbi:hypothetical protein GCK32_006573 [Trichostrongylus colubriformis]|uniref:Uncharacterized protein n=1 Tax=Trichostrongylus colubriformis TaxID=6319 RepID=A0AAN8G592_TRICO